MISCIGRLLFVGVCVCSPLVGSLDLSTQTTSMIATKIWKNECNESVLGLTHWNKGEAFPSMGIGHFIWYTEERKECFEQTFPQLLLFFKHHGVTLPAWLDQAKGCPWKSRDDFYREIHSPRMRELRQLLFTYKDLQARFMVQRLEKVLDDIVQALPEEARPKMIFLISALTSNAQGLYALIDYLNFKGSGLSPEEGYRGQQWGLFQVLQKVAVRPLLADFVAAGKEVLNNRVEKAPPDRKDEVKWLPGWLNRLDTYLEP